MGVAFDMEAGISIHALTGSATKEYDTFREIANISIHALTGSATN